MNWLILYIFQSQPVAPDIMVFFYHLTLCIYRNNNTVVSRSYNSITLFVGPLFPSESRKAVVCQWLPTDDMQCVLLCVSDSLQLVVMTCCVSVTVYSLLLCPVVCQWQFAACCYVLLCVSDSLQLFVVLCLSVTVCSLLLCPVVCQW